MKLRLILPTATFLALAQPLPTAAEPVSGPYIGLGAGADFREPSGSASTRVATDWGPVGVLGLGWGFGNGLRTELEGSYRSSEVGEVQLRNTLGHFRTVAPSGRIASTGLMANLLYEVDLGSFRVPVRPYLGGGIGYAWHQYEAVSGAANFALAGPGRRVFDDTDGGLAYQAIGGLSLPVGAVPGLDVTAEYRYFAMAEDARITGSNRSLAGAVLSQGTSRFANQNHSALLGLRYSFGAVPAAAPATMPAVHGDPPPAPVRTFLVFFDWDRAELTERARQIIGDAAGNAQRAQATRIEVAGHADRSGTPQYNQGLSRRRAEAVAAELVRKGVRREDITLTAFGESRPLVPTADGARELQNRRVEILLR